MDRWRSLATAVVVGATALVARKYLALRRELKLLREQQEQPPPPPPQQEDGKDQQSSPQRQDPAPARKKNVKAGSKRRALVPFELEEIGTVRTPFVHRAGTPRQGLLAPHARGRLELHTHVPPQTLQELDGFSHVWVLFRFHINVDREKKRAREANAGGHHRGFAAKVTPPRANGRKVGVFSTRSPHRPNPIGLSLGAVEKVDVTRRVVWLRGLDLVDGTPVYDLKPYIPWDVVPLEPPALVEPTLSAAEPATPTRSAAAAARSAAAAVGVLSVPSWVSDDRDELTRVTWTDDAANAVKEVVQTGALAPLYEKSDHDEVLQAIAEVVSQDPRAIYDGRGKPTSEAYGMTFSALRVAFEIRADGTASITHAELDPGDPTAPVGTYQNSLARRRAAEAEARKTGKTLVWKTALREGELFEAFDLAT